jgi:hypothetical protein
MHGGEVRAGDAALKAEPLRLRGERLDVPGQRIVCFIAMQVDAQAALSAIVRSKCGMPPTTSTPRSSARVRFSTAPGER